MKNPIKITSKLESSGFDNDLWQWAEEKRIASRIARPKCHRITRRLPFSSELVNRIRAILKFRLTSRP